MKIAKKVQFPVKVSNWLNADGSKPAVEKSQAEQEMRDARDKILL